MQLPSKDDLFGYYQTVSSKVKQYVRNLTPLEQKVMDATSNEPWGPHGTVMSGVCFILRTRGERWHEIIQFSFLLYALRLSDLLRSQQARNNTNLLRNSGIVRSRLVMVPRACIPVCKHNLHLQDPCATFYRNHPELFQLRGLQADHGCPGATSARGRRKLEACLQVLAFGGIHVQTWPTTGRSCPKGAPVRAPL